MAAMLSTLILTQTNSGTSEVSWPTAQRIGLGAGGVGLRGGGRQRAAGADGTADRAAVDRGDAQRGAGQARAGRWRCGCRCSGCAARGRSRRCPWRCACRPRSWRWPPTRPSRSSRRSRSAGRPRRWRSPTAHCRGHRRSRRWVLWRARSGVGRALDAPGVHLLGVPLVAGHEHVAGVVGDGLGAAEREGPTDRSGLAHRIGRIAEALPGAVGGVGVGRVEDAGVAVDAGDGAAVQAGADHDRIGGEAEDVRAHRAQADELGGGSWRRWGRRRWRSATGPSSAPCRSR